MGRRVTSIMTAVPLVLCAVAIAACSSGNSDSTSPTRPPGANSSTAAGASSTTRTTGASGTSGASGSAASGVVRSKGCASPAGLATEATVQSGGATRRYLLALPSDLRAPAPVVLDLHGLGEPAELQAGYSRLGDVGAPAGMIVVTPESDNKQNSWAYPVLSTKDSDFVGAILDQLEATRCVDTSREVAAGISNGAGLTDGLVCALGGRLAAIFPIAGVNILKPCATARRTTVVAFHGTADGLVPYQGGSVFSGVPTGGAVGRRLNQLLSPQERALFARIKLQPVETVIAQYARQFGCGAPSDRQVGTGVRLRSYGGCTGKATVALYTIDGGGHTWPGGAGSSVGALGETTHAISASEVIVDTVKRLAAR